MFLSRSLASSAVFALSLSALTPGLAHAEDEAEIPDPSGHYIESEIPGRSGVFRSVGESTARTFAKVEGNLQDIDGRLAKMALSVGLAGSAVDADSASLWNAKMEARSDTFGYEFEGVQVRLNQMQVAYQEAFEGALQRAIDGLAAEGSTGIVPCVPKSGSALGALAGGGPGGASAGPSTDHCLGTDFSQEIARRWDADDVLEERVLEIVGGDLGPLVIGVDPDGAPLEYGSPLAAGGWPAITTYEEPGQVIGLTGQVPAGATWLLPADLVISMPEMAEVLDRVDELSSGARSDLQGIVKALPRDDAGNLLQDEANLPRIQAVQNKARGIRTFSDEGRAQVGAALWEALIKLRKKGKKAGWSDVGLCLNPPGFGGCEGTDVTDVVAEALAGDKKLTARLQEITEGLAVPDVSVP